MSKAIPQLNPQTSQELDDLIHIVRNNVDYKITVANQYAPMRDSQYAPGYDNAFVYGDSFDTRWALYNNELWEYIGPIGSGVAPGTDPTRWVQRYSAALSHVQNKDTLLDQSGDNEVSAEEIRAGVNFTTITLTDVEIKALFTTPIQLIPAPGAGKAIEVKSATARLNYGTAAYTSSILQIITSGEPAAQLDTAATFLQQTSSRIVKFTEVSSVQSMLAENTAIFVNADADSVVGDSTIDLYINYRIITL